MILLSVPVLARDVPFVFGEGHIDVSSYTPDQIEQASYSSFDLKGVPPITQPSDNALLNFPVVGGGNGPGGETEEKKVSNLKKLFNALVEDSYLLVS